MAVKAGSKAERGALPNALVELPGEAQSDPEDLEMKEEQTEPSKGFQVVSSAKEHRMPEFPAKRVEANKSHLFFEWIEKLEEADFDHLSFYIYRNWPVIDRKKVNPLAGLNIGKLTGKVGCSLEYITSEYGSGDYKILVNDINKTVNGKGGTIGHAFVVIRDASKPPILIYDELVVDDPQNRTYVDGLKAKGIISNEGRLMTPAAGGNNNDALIGLLRDVIANNQRQAQQLPVKDASMDSIASMYKSTHEATMGMLKDQIKTDGPDKTLGLITAIQGLMPKAENHNVMLELFMKMQLDATARADAANARVMELLSKTPVDAEAKVLEKMALYKELFGGGDGISPKRSTTEIVIEAIAPMGAKVFDIIANVLSMKNYQAGLIKNQQQPIQHQPEMQPAAQQIQQGDNVIEMPTPQQQPKSELEQMLGAYGGFILEAVKRGDTGDIFAQAVETMAGPLVYKKIAATGAEQLFEGMKSTEPFWVGVQHIGATEDVMKQFCDAFVAYGVEEEEEEGKE